MSAATLDLTKARDLRAGDRILLVGRGRTPWLVTGSVRREDGAWSLACKRGREHNVLRTFADSWFDKVVK